MTNKNKIVAVAGGGLTLALLLVLGLLIPGCSKAQDERAITQTITEAFADLSTRHAQPERVIAACNKYLTEEFRESLYFCSRASFEVGFGGGTYAILITSINIVAQDSDSARAIVSFDNDTADASYSKWSNSVRLIKKDDQWFIAKACSPEKQDTDPLACLDRP